jgi:hypothetical protein
MDSLPTWTVYVLIALIVVVVISGLGPRRRGIPTSLGLLLGVVLIALLAAAYWTAGP